MDASIQQSTPTQEQVQQKSSRQLRQRRQPLKTSRLLSVTSNSLTASDSGPGGISSTMFTRSILITRAIRVSRPSLSTMVLILQLILLTAATDCSCLLSELLPERSPLHSSPVYKADSPARPRLQPIPNPLRRPQVRSN